MPEVTVCVVDDDPLYRQAICFMLHPAGYQTVEAEEGEAGLKEIERARATVLIVDMLMPGKEGMETITEAKRRFPGLKIIAISGGGIMKKSDLLSLARNLGADACLEKPFRAKELLETLAGIFEVRSGSV
jgi:DNA-binding response OmpR family regulator